MKKLFIVANWKSNMDTRETKEWLQTFTQAHIRLNKDEKEVIICPPFTLLPLVNELIVASSLPLAVGSQDVSSFERGAHTGEVHADQVQEFATHAIIGHSERRNELGETDALIAQKAIVAKEHGLTPIVCVQGIETPVPQGVSLVAYEPIFAIGTGNPDTPKNAESVIQSIKEKYGVQYVLYGGSVTVENVHTFTQMPSIDGVLVGGASLDPNLFAEIITKA